MTDEKIIYKDGKYTGDSVNALYGQVQVEAIIRDGKVVDIKVLEYPRANPVSMQKSGQAVIELREESIKSQDSNINAISGATETSIGFIKSLESALEKAKYNLKLI